MNIIAKDGPVTIRKMEANEADFQQFLTWMTDSQTMKYWEGMTERFTYERVVEEYQEHVEEQVEQCFILYAERTIGYCQFCVIRDAEDYDVPEALYAQFADESALVYGIDVFIGETDCRDCGIGTVCMKVLMAALFQKYQADILVIDPKVHNARAIRCYRKCGFKEWFTVPERELQDGVYHDSLIMGVRREDFA